MTARDFTPTDEQKCALGDVLVSLAPHIVYGRRYTNAVYLAASPAFQSIIAAAKAEERDRLAALVMDDERGLPFNSDHDLAVVAAWIKEASA